MKASSVEASAAKGWYDDLGNTNEWRPATHPSSPGLAGRAERGKRADLGEHKRGPPSATPEKKQIKQPQPNCMFGRIKGSTWATYRLQSCGCSAEWRSRLPFSCQDRKRVVSGKSVSVRVDRGGRRIIKKKKKTQNMST